MGLIVFPYNLNGIPCDEPVDGYNEQLSVDAESGATRRLRCAWNDRLLLATYFLGSSTVPRQGHPTISGLWASTVSINPFGKPTGGTSWEYADLEIIYRPLNFSGSDPNTLRSEAMDISGGAFTREGLTHKDEDGNLITDTVTRYNNFIKYSVTISSAPVLPLVAIVDCLDKVNSSAMTIKLGQGNTASVDSGHVVYEGPSGVSRNVTSAGEENWTITHNFLISAVDHRKRFVNGKLQTITERESGDPIYEEANFSSLGV